MPLFDKNHLKKYSLMLIFFIVSLGFIAVFSIIRRDSQHTALQNAVSTVLSHHEDNRYSLVKEFVFPQPIKSSLRIFELKDNKHSSDKVFAALVRITGFSGPHSCVLILHPESEICSFIGIAGYPFPQYSDTINYGISSSMIEYWENNILEILQTGGLI